MKKPLHPLVMLLLVAAAALFGRVLPTWTLSLATVAASNALIALGIVILARTGNVSFGQGLFYAAGGYGVALIASAWGITDAVAQMLIGAVCGGLLGLVIGPLIARYSGIFFGMLTLALSMVLYGALVKTTALGGSDGFNIGRPTLLGFVFTDTREADFMLYAVSVAWQPRSCSVPNWASSASRFEKTICGSSISGSLPTWLSVSTSLSRRFLPAPAAHSP